MSDVKARHDKMVGLVETMLKLHNDLPKANTPHEQEFIQRQIAATGPYVQARKRRETMDRETKVAPLTHEAGRSKDAEEV
jgi:hypothetical protein